MYDVKKAKHDYYIARRDGTYVKPIRLKLFDRKKWAREYHQSHKEQRKKLNSQFLERHPHYRQQLRLKYKIEVLTYYGKGKLACVECGESRPLCLSIDHINGGGNKHRKELGHKKSNIYRLLKLQGYPEGYQTLCMNCQFIHNISKENQSSTY
jgi:hypothetical protein